MLITLIIFILWFKSEQKAADKWFSRVFHTFDSLLLIKETELIVIIVKMGKTLEGCPGTTPQAHMTLTFDTEATVLLTASRLHNTKCLFTNHQS